MIVTILFVGSIPNFGINIIEPRQDVLKVIYFAKDVHQAYHKMAPHVGRHFVTGLVYVFGKINNLQDILSGFDNIYSKVRYSYPPFDLSS